MGKVVAIHQPNFFPWLGYFDKIARCDTFVILDDVQNQKKAGTWSNRVKLLISGEARWVTAPIVRNYSGYRKIKDMEFCSNNPWRTKILKSIEMNYKKTSFFSETFSLLEPLIFNPENNIAKYNSKVILNICKKIGIDINKMFWSSKLPHEGKSNELLVSLTKAVGGDAYMCGGGADGYQDDSVFAEAGMRLKYQDFKHPQYPQAGSSEFIAGLSIIDALMNLGIDKMKAMLKHSNQESTMIQLQNV